MDPNLKAVIIVSYVKVTSNFTTAIVHLWVPNFTEYRFRICLNFTTGYERQKYALYTIQQLSGGDVMVYVTKWR
jgi:hypothetical protein